jgi:hypothetical protein
VEGIPAAVRPQFHTHVAGWAEAVAISLPRRGAHNGSPNRRCEAMWVRAGGGPGLQPSSAVRLEPTSPPSSSPLAVAGSESMVRRLESWVGHGRGMRGAQQRRVRGTAGGAEGRSTGGRRSWRRVRMGTARGTARASGDGTLDDPGGDGSGIERASTRTRLSRRPTMPSGGSPARMPSPRRARLGDLVGPLGPGGPGQSTLTATLCCRSSTAR